MAVQVGEVHARFLEQRALGQYARAAATAARTRPLVLTKRPAVGAFQGGDDAILQAAKERHRALGHRCAGAPARVLGRGHAWRADRGRSAASLLSMSRNLASRRVTFS